MNNGNGPDEPTEFDRLMALDDEAFVKEVTGQSSDDGTTPPAAAAGEPESNPSGGQPVPGEAGGTGEPVSQPGTTEPGSADWLAALPEDVQNRIKADREERDRKAQEAEDRYKALHGRLAPTQQALAETQQRLAQYQRTPATTVAEPPAQQPGQSLDSYFDSEIWKEWAEMYPGDAKVLRNGLEAQRQVLQGRIDQLEQRYGQLEQRLGQTEQVATRTVVNDGISRLDATHKDWRDINQSDEFWEWADGWRATQPAKLRELYYDDVQWRDFWNDPDFAIARISEFKAATQRAPEPPVATTTPTTQPESTQPTAQPPANNPRLSMSVAPEVRGSPVPPAISTDGLSEAELFEHLWNQS